MKTIHLSYPHDYKKTDLPETSAAIGFFDGIHLGHQTVIDEAMKDAKNNDRESAVITFFPHPSVVLRKEVTHALYITPLMEKKEILEKMGLDRLYVIEFNEKLAALQPEEFVTYFLSELNIKHIAAGFDFSFGHKGKGNMDNIEEFLNEEQSYSVVKKVEKDGEKISSTKIRSLLANGRMKEANQLLGRLLSLTGKVVEGDKRGRTIGYPTANIAVSNEYFLPKTGVYAVSVIIDEEEWKGMANLGFNPTFVEDLEEPVLEVHLFDFDEEIYGKTVTLLWHDYVREEKKFSGAEELIENMQNDELKIRSFF